MIDLKLNVDHPDQGGEYVVGVTFATIIAAEEHFGVAMQEMFAPVSAIKLAWLAWEQTRADGTHGPVKPFEDWKTRLAGVDANIDDTPLGVTP